MDVVNSDSDEEMRESTDDEEDEPDFVDVEENANVDHESPGAPHDEFTHRSDAPEEAPVKRPANPSDPTQE